MTLESPAAAPYPFAVRLKVGNAEQALEITGIDAKGARSTHRYALSGREQSDYLDLIEMIARDFGTRLPRNRQESLGLTFKAPYRVLLDRNISPEIWYGYGDPAVTFIPAQRTGDGDWYYLFATSNDAPNSFPILRSRSLESWEPVGFVFPEGRKPSWAADGLNVSDYWAPEMHIAGDQYIVCFTARENDGSLASRQRWRDRSPSLRDTRRPHVPVLEGGFERCVAGAAERLPA
jgi:hypothetical protein